MTEQQRIGQRIRAIRKAQGLSAVVLAELAGMTQQQISEIENAKYAVRIDTLERIATALKCRVDFIDERPHVAKGVLA